MENIAVIVTHNKVEYLKKCVKALLNQSYPIDRLIIFDNASTDETKQYIQSKKIEKIDYIYSDQNLGGAGGFNAGIKQAMTYNPQNVWVMDEDTIVDGDALKELVLAKKKIQGIEFGFLASNVLWQDFQPCIMNIPVPCKNWNVKATDGLIQIQSASFVSMYINSKAIKELGYPISEFFIWGDDVEFSKRISKNYPSYFVAKSVVIHEMVENKSVDILTEKSERVNRYFYDVRNKMYMLRKENWKKSIKFNCSFLLLIIKIIFLPTCKNKLKKTLVMLKGYFFGFFFNPKIDQYYEGDS